MELKTQQLQVIYGEEKWRHFERVVRLLGQYDQEVARRLQEQNAKLPDHAEKEEAKLLECWLTQNSICQGFIKVFGSRCDVMAKLLYMLASRDKDHAQVHPADFFTTFTQLLVSHQAHC